MPTGLNQGKFGVNPTRSRHCKCFGTSQIAAFNAAVNCERQLSCDEFGEVFLKVCCHLIVATDLFVYRGLNRVKGVKNLTQKEFLSRLLQIVLVLIGISFLTFSLVMLSPGDPVRQMIVGNEDIIVSQAEIEALRHELGLDKPFLLQYVDWLGKAVQGNLGFSYMSKMDVTTKLLETMPATIYLAGSALCFMLIVSVPLGIYSAVRSNTYFDYGVRALSFVGVSIPSFWLGLILLWIFGLQLGWLPIVGGRIALETLILPTITLGSVMASKYTRQVRAAVLEELQQDYVIGAQARGMSESYILWREILPNAMLPLITLLGLSLGSLLGGAAVIEIVFSWPGLGRLAVEAITYRDFNLVQGIVLWCAIMYMFVNLLVDVSYSHLDPRLRKGYE